MQSVSFMGEKSFGNENEGITGFGLGGFLASFGTHHIVNNETFKDNWVELEIKLKGGAITPYGKISYSYRGGMKLHSEKEIRDTMYFGIKRSHSDNRVKHWSLFKNTEIDFRGDLALDTFEITRMTPLLEKNTLVKIKNVFTLLTLVLSGLEGKVIPDQSLKRLVSLVLVC